MFHIGICDDEETVRGSLYLLLEKQLTTDSHEPDIIEFSSGEDLLTWFEENPYTLEILFLDVQMGAMDGLETARKIRTMNDTVIIIFVTGYADYVFDGYQVDALDYLIKPLTSNRLEQVLKRAVGLLKKQDTDIYILQNTEGVFRISKQQILYCYSHSRKVTFVTAKREYTCYDKLDQIEHKLGEGFIRIHQRYLIRAKAVDEVTGSKVHIGETVLPISRSYASTAMLSLIQNLLD